MCWKFQLEVESEESDFSQESRISPKKAKSLKPANERSLPKRKQST